MSSAEQTSGGSPVKAPYTSLYRRWRPQLFSQVLGQEHVTRSLQNALVGNRIAHAYLFCGLRGTGKTTMAKLLGKALNCLEGVNAEPCNRCRSCVEVTEGRNLDVMEIDAASNRGIDEIRDLREKVRYAAAQNRYKVYIIDEVHMLTQEAFNALLKVLEEPPPLVVFVLATTEVHKIPLTIVSRCQRYDFHLLEVEQLAGRLQAVADEMHFSADEKTLILLARQAEGAVRDALGLLEQCRAYGGESISYEQALEILGLPAPAVLHGYYQAVVDEDLASGLAVIREAVQRGMDLQRLIREQILYLRKLLLLQAEQDETTALADVPALRSYLLQHRDKFDSAVILEMLEILQLLTYQLRGASQPQFLLELAFLRLARVYRFRSYFSPGELMQRLEALEEKLLASGKGRLEADDVVETIKSDKIDTITTNREARPSMDMADKEKTKEQGQRAGTAEDNTLQTEDFGVNIKETVSEVREGPPEENESIQAVTEAENETAATVAFDDAPGVDSAPEGTIPEGGLTLFWEEKFLARLRKNRKHNLLAYLMEATPLSWKGGVFAVTISPKRAYLKKRLEAEKNRKYIDNMLEELLGAPAAMRVILDSSESSSEPAEKHKSLADQKPQKTGSSSGAASPGDTKQAASPPETHNENLMPQILDLFQGRLIEAGINMEEKGKSFSPGEYWADGEPIPPPPDMDENEDED